MVLQCSMKVAPPRGLIALRTKAEIRANLETTTVYVVEIPTKAAYGILKAVESVVHNPSVPSLHHLRRFVKTDNLPLHLQDLASSPDAIRDPTTVGPETSCFANLTRIANDLINESSVEKQHRTNDDDQKNVHFLICATSNLSVEGVAAVLKSFQPCSGYSLLTRLRIVTVPLFPPISDEQAKQWSRSHWPTVYNRNSPFGPHWKIISRAEDEINDQAGAWVDLAKHAGIALSQSLLGEPIGAVILDRNPGRTPLLIAAAGDARWGGIPEHARSGCGNVMAHAVMRAIGLVARKRRELTHEASGEGGSDLSSIFADKPLTSIESDAYSVNKIAPGGYLCLGLEIYVTHEPCVMCSMAILHSRFARVVFGERLPRTGGITAGAASEELQPERQPHLGYGLFWRPELNWKLLAWQWVDEPGCSQVESWSPIMQA